MNLYDIDSPETVALFDEMPLWSGPSGLELLNHVHFRKRLRILDIGFGTGFPLLELAERACRSCKVYGIDPWEAAVARAIEKSRIYGIENVEFQIGRAEQMPFRKDFFDLVVSNNGLNNIEDPLPALRECYRVSRRNSVLLFTANLPGTLKEFYDVFREVLKERKKLKELNALEQHVREKRRTMLEWEGLLNEAGYRLSGLWENEFFYRFANGTTLFDHHFIRLAFLPAWVEIVKKKDRVEIFGEIEAILNSMAVTQGGLKMTVPFACYEARKK